MHAEILPLPKPVPPSASNTVSEEDYLQWTRRFDLLWSSTTSEPAQHEMQALIRLIEQYEITHNASRTSTQIKGDIS